MEQYLAYIHSDSALLILAGLIAASMFFSMAGLRDLFRGYVEGLMYLVVALFFAVVHVYLLLSNLWAEFDAQSLAQASVWGWLLTIAAPALIGLYLLLGVFNLVSARLKEAIIKLIFGLSLAAFLFVLGPNWPLDVHGVMILIWMGLWFHLEIKCAA